MGAVVESELEARVSEIAAAARLAGRRMTRQRMAVVRALVFNGHHPGVGELYGQVAAQHPRVSLATVYKTLDMLKSLHEVLQLEFGEGHSRFEATQTQSHPHLVCTGCGAIEDFLPARLDDLLAEAFHQAGYRIEHYRFDLFGRCLRCSGADQAPA